MRKSCLHLSVCFLYSQLEITANITRTDGYSRADILVDDITFNDWHCGCLSKSHCLSTLSRPGTFEPWCWGRGGGTLAQAHFLILFQLSVTVSVLVSFFREMSDNWIWHKDGAMPWALTWGGVNCPMKEFTWVTKCLWKRPFDNPVFLNLYLRQQCGKKKILKRNWYR